jgi:hypothetical protein
LACFACNNGGYSVHPALYTFIELGCQRCLECEQVVLDTVSMDRAAQIRGDKIVCERLMKRERKSLEQQQQHALEQEEHNGWLQAHVMVRPPVAAQRWAWPTCCIL